jgi:hypothetical protein
LQFKFSPFCPKEKEENTTDETEEKNGKKYFAENYIMYTMLLL